MRWVHADVGAKRRGTDALGCTIAAVEQPVAHFYPALGRNLGGADSWLPDVPARVARVAAFSGWLASKCPVVEMREGARGG